MVVMRRSGYEVRTIENQPLDKEVHELEWDLEEIEKGGSDHFVLKEIVEQPESLENSMRGRVSLDTRPIKLGGLLGVVDGLRGADRGTIGACGAPGTAG